MMMTMTKMMTMTVLMSNLIPDAMTLTAFDCTHADSRLMTIDLLEPQTCPDPDTDYEDPEEVRTQIVQMDVKVPIVGYRCKALITKKVSRCGFTSIDYGHSYPAWKKVLEVTPEECRQAMQSGKLPVGNRQVEIMLNRKTTVQYFSVGSRDPDGRCITGSFYSEGIFFTGSYEEVFLEATVEQIRGVADSQTDTVTFVNGIQANSRDQVLRDSMEGVIIWELPELPCQETVSQIYMGQATLRARKDRKDLLEAILTIRENVTDRYAGFVLRRTQSVCGVHCFGTQGQHGIVACVLRPGDAPVAPATFKEHVEIGEANLQSQISYLHLSSNLNLNKRFRDLQSELCELDRRTLHTRLQAIVGADNPYALLDIYGPGYSIEVGGAAAYITKCFPVDVTLTDFPNCTAEIPVKYNGTLRFVDPMSRVLRVFPVVIPCSPIAPVRWKIEGQWYCAEPWPRECRAPEKLNVTFGMNRYHLDFTKALGRGIYSKEQLEKHHLFMASQHTREAVLAKVTIAATESAVLPGRPGFPIDPADLPRLSYAIGYHISPLAYFFGDLWKYLFTASVFIGMAKMLLNVVIRAARIYKLKGCGWWILSAVWGTLFLIVAYPFQILKQAVHKLEEGFEEIPGVAEGTETAAPETEREVSNFHDLNQQLAHLRRMQDAIMEHYDRMMIDPQGVASAARESTRRTEE